MTVSEKEKILKYMLDSADVELSIAEVSDDMSLREDLGFDSLAAVEMVMELEDEFSISLSDNEVASLRLVGDVFKLIDQKHAGAVECAAE